MIEIGLMYGQKLNNWMARDFLPIDLIKFADSSFAENLEDQKSVIGYFFLLNKVVVSWCSKKQRTIFTLITKAKYIALSYTTKEVVRIWKYINKMELNMTTLKSIILYGNNEMSIVLIKNTESQHQIKHIDV